VKRNLILLITLPVALGLLTWQAFRLRWLPDSILYLRANLGLLIFIAGLLLSTLLGIGLYFYLRFEHRARNESNSALDYFSTEHRQFL